jgi:hypothetical protein
VSEEKRREPRLPVRVEAEVRFSSWDVFKLLWTVNISHGGMNLEVVGDQPEVGSNLIVRIYPPAGDSIDLAGIVKHVSSATKRAVDDKSKQKFQVGVQFVNLDEDRKQAVEKTLAGKGGEITLRRKE